MTENAKDNELTETVSSMKNPKLKELVDEFVMDHGFEFRDASKRVYTLWKRGDLELLESRPSSTLIRYALSLQSLWFWAITALLASMISIVFYAVDPPFLYLRNILGSLFVLYVLGSMLIEALYPKSQDLESLERLALSIGLSLAAIILISLLLNYTPWGIRLTPLTISLATFTEAMAVIALIRKYRYYALTRPLS